MGVVIAHKNTQYLHLDGCLLGKHLMTALPRNHRALNFSHVPLCGAWQTLACLGQN